MTGWQVAVALACVAGAGGWAWLVGRRLQARADDPTLPERLVHARGRLLLVTLVALFASASVANGTFRVVLVPLTLFAALAGWLPARKALFRERWGLGAYASHVARTWTAFVGFWVVLSITPAWILYAGSARWIAATVLGAGLLLWNERFTSVFLRLVRARPLERSDLEDRFAAILARSSAAAPSVYRAWPAGGSSSGAVALPEESRSAVVFGETLLTDLEPDEIAAVFAHEVAHLEHFRGPRLLRAHVTVLLLIATAVGAGFLASDFGWISLAWALGVPLAAAALLARRQAHEAESDLRAADLCGDPEALIRGLTKVHALMRAPRRRALQSERGASHPSLARRIQAIRAHGSRVVTAQAVPDAAPTIVELDVPGDFVVLEEERVHWLAGVPADVPRTSEVLRGAARSVRTLAYGDVAELWVDVRHGSPWLRATDGVGRQWGVPLRDTDLGVVQAALDRVDSRFARGVSRSPSGWMPSWRICGAFRCWFACISRSAQRRRSRSS